MRVFHALRESEPRVQVCGESYLKSVRHRCACTEEHIHPTPHPHHCCRFSADLPSTCHMLLRPSHEFSLWRFMTEKGTETPGGNSKERIWKQTSITTPCSRLTCFAFSVEDSGLHLTQLLHHIVKQAVPILQQIIPLIIFYHIP